MSQSALRFTRRQFLAASSVAAGTIATTGPAAAVVSTRHDRLIVDAQVHIWLPSTAQQPWPNPKAVPQMPEPYTLEHLLPMMDEGGVDRVVLVPPSWHGPQLGNAYCQAAYEQYPDRFRVIGIGIGLDEPHRVNEVLNIRQKPGFLGLRVGMNREALDKGTGDWLFAAAEKAGVPICYLGSGVNAHIGQIAERFPGLDLVVDHMGVSEAFMKANPNTWQDEVKVVAALAKYPNVSVKVSSTPFVSSQGYPWRDTIPLVQRCFDAFGPLRCHWGTDLTHSYEKGSYRLRIAQFTEALPFLSESDKDWVMGRSLLARLRWA